MSTRKTALRVSTPCASRTSLAFVARRLAAALLGLAMLLGVRAPAWAAPPPRYAAFLVDANSREVLYANAPDELRHPASLTKMMTLYLTFDAIESGRLRLSDPVTMSRHATSMAPSRLGLAVGQSISVDNAISVVAVKSANDVAVAHAETIAGNEPAFVEMMNAKARQLGMRNTHFANACGLTDPNNVTTARDLAILSLALIHDHPRFYRYFSERDFVWKRETMINHNHLLGKMVGLDGIKTGYTADSGFTIALSAVRGNRRLVAIVLGEPSLVARNRDATALLEAGFSVLDRRALGQMVTVASALPSLDHPALRTETFAEQGSSDDDDRPIALPVRHARGAGRPHAAAGRRGRAAAHVHAHTAARNTHARTAHRAPARKAAHHEPAKRPVHRHHDS